MPIYEYTCNKCNHVHDAVRSVDNRDSPIECPECASMDSIKNVTGAMGAVDTKLTPDKATGGQYSQLMDKMKRGTPKAYHETLDRSSSRNGSIWGNN
jgi:putative FmdB family regulatory protein